MFNPYLGPMGHAVGCPIAIQLASDLTQAKMRAASSMVASVADAVSSYAGAMTQFATAYAYPFAPPMGTVGATTTARPVDSSYVRVNPTVGRGMRMTMVEGDESYIAHVEMPNVAPEDITVKAGDRIEVTGGSTTAYCALPNDAERDGITAEYRDSILTLRIPKEAKHARREIRVKVVADKGPVKP